MIYGRCSFDELERLYVRLGLDTIVRDKGFEEMYDEIDADKEGVNKQEFVAWWLFMINNKALRAYRSLNGRLPFGDGAVCSHACRALTSCTRLVLMAFRWCAVHAYNEQCRRGRE
eukprot:SAG31_NODE_5599_length_2429_cov_36.011588_2_plen_115_part_00